MNYMNFQFYFYIFWGQLILTIKKKTFKFG